MIDQWMIDADSGPFFPKFHHQWHIFRSFLAIGIAEMTFPSALKMKGGEWSRWNGMVQVEG